MTMSLRNALALLVLGLTLGGQVQSGGIIGGHEAVPHSRPYMVLLERRVTDNITLFCDGFLLSDEFVLTAAHCRASVYYVYVGRHKFINNQTPKGIEVRQAVPHENYNEIQKINDIMILKLSEKVQRTENVRWIKLARRNDHLPHDCMVCGWGHSKEKRSMASELREVNVTLVVSSSCAEHKTYCSVGDIGPYFGDSGGPLVCEGELAFGFVSFRSGGDWPSQIVNVFGKIPDYLNWIKRQIKKM